MSGFQHAPITKGMMIVTGLASLAVSIMDLKPYVHLPLVPHLTRDLQLYRLVVHQIVFQNSVELFMAELSLYHISRFIERSFGSRKFAALILTTAIWSTTLSIFCLIFFHKLGLAYIPAGGFSILAALLYQYVRSVPSLYAFKIFGVTISNKSFTFVYPVLLIIHQFPLSLIAAIPGLFFGMIYRSDSPLIPMRLQPSRFRIPASVYNLLSRLLSPIFASSPAPPPRRADRVLPPEFTERRATPLTDRAVAEALTRGMFGSGAAVQAIPPPANLRGSPGSAVAEDIMLSPSRVLAARLGVPQGGITTSAGAATGAEAQTPPGTAPSSPQTSHRTFGLPVGDWMNRMTGQGESANEGENVGSSNSVRAPTETEIEAISSMFPNLSREVVVRALQRSDYNSALAVEMLLEQST